MEGKGRLFFAASQFSDLVILGAIWMVCCIPVVTIGPACTALYYAAVKSVRFGQGRPLREFWRTFKENLRQGILISAFYGIADIGTEWFILAAPDTISKIAGVTGICVLIGTGLYLFPVMSRFALSVPQYFQVSIIFLLGYPGNTLCLFFVLLLCAVTAVFLPFLLPVLAGCYAYYATFFLEKIFRKYMRHMEDANAWYFDTEM